jgi:hypothetical protein
VARATVNENEDDNEYEEEKRYTKLVLVLLLVLDYVIFKIGLKKWFQKVRSLSRARRRPMKKRSIHVSM